MAGGLSRAGVRKRKRRKIWVPVLLLVAAGVGGFFAYQKFLRGPAQAETGPQPMIDQVVRTTIERTFSGTGKLISAAEVSIGTGTKSETAVKVAEVYVKVGDRVKKGDILYTLDMSDVENELAIQQQKLALQEQLEAVERQAAYRALADAQYATSSQYNSATTTMIRKAEDTNDDIIVQVDNAEDVIKYQQDETDKKAAFESAKALYDQVKASHDDITARYNEKGRTVTQIDNEIALLTAERDHLTALDPAAKNTDAYKQYEAQIAEKTFAREQAKYDQELLTPEMTRLQENLEKATEDKNLKEADYEEAKAKAEAADEAFKTGKTTIKQDTRAMEDLVPEVEKNNRSALNAEAAARESIESSRINTEIQSIDTEEEIRKKQEMLENGIITASMDGIVTTLNVEPGKGYAGGEAVVLQNLDLFKVTAEIDEAHIADIQTGMRVRVTTDSTGEMPLTGTVTFTSPTPTVVQASPSGSGGTQTQQSTSTAKATYRVEITLDEANERLRVGMTAKIEFILLSAENVIAVPTAFLTMNENGESVVTLAPEEDAAPEEDFAEEGIPDWEPIDGEGTAPEGGSVVVTTGIADDYYTEITSGNLEEGTMIQGQAFAFDGGNAGLLEGIY